MGVCEARGLAVTSLEDVRDELDRWGCWMKRRRPKPRLEEVGHELLIEYLRRRTRFRSKSRVSSIASKMRCLGEYLVHQGVWQQNRMRWVKGPRLDGRGNLPRRVGAGHLSKLWEATAQQGGAYSKHLAVVILALLYGTGLRRGELERLHVSPSGSISSDRKLDFRAILDEKRRRLGRNRGPSSSRIGDIGHNIIWYLLLNRRSVLLSGPSGCKKKINPTNIAGGSRLVQSPRLGGWNENGMGNGLVR